MRTETTGRLKFWLGGLLALFCAGQAQAAGEYELKAAFLYNFALFTEWPGTPATMKFCVLGHDPFGKAISPLSQKSVHGVTVQVTHIDSAAEARSCQVLFIASSEHPNVPAIFEQLREEPVLTVAESNGFDRKMVMIVMVSANNRVGFDISQSAAQQAGLKLSSQLLKLARQVQ